MQVLFYMDKSRNDSKDTLELYRQNFPVSKELFPFFIKLVNGVILAKFEIDSIIERFSSNWKISRMSCVDRNMIRIAVYELLFCHDIPSKVSINEAIDIGKKFGTKESGAFINGILDGINMAIEEKEIAIKEELPEMPAPPDPV